MQRVARFALALGFGLITIRAVLKAVSRETMVNLVWLSFLPAAIVLSACGQDAPEPATSTGTPLPTAMPVPTAIPTATRDLSALSLPTAGYVGKDYATGACTHISHINPAGRAVLSNRTT